MLHMGMARDDSGIGNKLVIVLYEQMCYSANAHFPASQRKHLSNSVVKRFPTMATVKGSSGEKS
jgi:hypothetical protein